MENPLFSDEVLAFIKANRNTDPYKLLMQKSPFENVSMRSVVQQIQGQKVAIKKYPFLLDYVQYIYPPKVSLEQASSQQTADYKADMISGGSFVDLTGGMGIDSFLLGRKFKECLYLEPNKKLFSTTMHNFEQLGYHQCKGQNITAEEFLNTNSQVFDWVYIDPSRRVDGNRKTSIENYEPNIVSLKDQLLATGKHVMIKLSPMQDISECISVLEYVEKVWIISIKNDVKELLLKLGKEKNDNPEIVAVDLAIDKMEFCANYQDRITEIDWSLTKKYIYQPASALVKSELHNKYAKSLDLDKLHPNTQLYTSDANVITKNYPMSSAQLVTKLKIKNGGDDYLLAFTDMENRKLIVICNRV